MIRRRLYFLSQPNTVQQLPITYREKNYYRNRSRQTLDVT